eukprot:TRINITY_DN1054_c0_g1_i9.p3 TRINITY_DN1054_c0_g1~~TRINITY_DN1054_c0_g1_i9.p3  ORF type:complete len:141 (-),score=3.02 TRINITY_DN1054_c0_g1_i9:276-698(-)
MLYPQHDRVQQDYPDLSAKVMYSLASQGDYRLKPMEVRGNNRSVMPLDVLGRTRATLTGPASTSPWPRGLGNLVKPCRAGDRALQLLLFNEECLVGTSHQLVPITSLPFVHTARRYYRLDGLVRPSDRPRRGRPTALAER